MTERRGADITRDPLDLRLEPHQLMEDLAIFSNGISAASDRLGRALKELEGIIWEEDAQGRKTNVIRAIGVKHLWEQRLGECITEVEKQYETEAQDPENKLPATMKKKSSERIKAEALALARKRYQNEWVAYIDAQSEVDALREWLKQKERAASLRQTILSAQAKGGGEGSMTTPGPTYGGQRA